MADFFLNPWMLAALAAVLLPPIIEWLFRRRKRQVELPTIRFLLDNEEQEKIRRQDLILLLMRMLAIGLLVLAIARPILEHGLVGGARQRNVIVLLDGTASMNQQVDVTTAFGLAQKKASSVIRSLPEGTSVTVFNFGSRNQLVVENEKDLHTAAARVEALRASSGAEDASAALMEIVDWVKEKKLEQAELYVFSDFQKYTWLRGDVAGEVSKSLSKLATNTETFMVDVGGDPKFNYLVTMLQPTEHTMSAGVPVRFQVQVESRGKVPPDATAPVTFLVDGVKKSVQNVAMTGEARTLEFDYRFPGDGEYLVEAVIDGDAHRVDNRRMFLTRVPADVRVLILDESVEGEGPASGKSLFLERAIRPPSHPGMEKVSHFLPKTIAPIRVSYENLNEYAVVILTADSRLDDSIVGLLERYVSDGGKLWLFMGPAVNLYDYNKYLYKETPAKEGEDADTLRPGQGLMPAKLVSKVSGAADGAEPPYPVYGNSSHVAMMQFRTEAGSQDAAFKEYVSVAVPPESKVVLALNNKAPAMVEKPFGKGRVILTCTTAGPEWTNLPATLEYPVMIQDMLRYLVGDPDHDVNLGVNDVFDQQVYVTTQQLLLRQPDGAKTRLMPMKLSGEGDDAIYHIVFDDTTQQGLYRIEAIPEVLARRRFVVNQDSAEGDLTRLSEGDFKDAFSVGGWTWIEQQRNIQDLASKLHTITELAPPILWVLTAILAIETLLAWRFGRRRGEVAAV